MDIDHTDLAWLAGLLEGEGSFMMGRNTVGGKVYFYPKIVVTMTDKDIIDRVSDLFGVTTYKLPDASYMKKQQWRSQVSGYKAAVLMEALIPFMGFRRTEKIKEILELYGDIEPTEVRRAKSCSESQKKRWKKHGTRSGRL